LSINRNRSIFPIILIAAGLLLVAGVLISVFLLRPTESQVSTSPPGGSEPFPQIARLNLAQAKDAYDTGAAVFVDVRDQVYYENSHISGAISLPLSQLESRLDELEPNDWIILYCT